MTRTTAEMGVMNTWERLEAEIVHPELIIARKVREQGYPNMFGARIRVNSKLNIDKWEQHCQDYEDKGVIDGMKYGWPTGRIPGKADPAKTYKNHAGAREQVLQANPSRSSRLLNGRLHHTREAVF